MPLPAKETYTIDDLMGGLSGIGADQDPCDRPTLERAVARACGYRPAKGPTIAIPGILAMLGGAFLLGGVVFPRKRTKKA